MQISLDMPDMPTMQRSPFHILFPEHNRYVLICGLRAVLRLKRRYLAEVAAPALLSCSTTSMEAMAVSIFE